MSIEFKHTVLPNGLTVIAEVDRSAHTAAIGFFVNTGARDEAPSRMGVSHFLEHMMFKGTATRTAEQVDRAFDDIGADHNAYTTSEMTAFWAHCLPEHLATVEEVLAEILRPALRPDDFEQEKKVILEEIAMYEDFPFWVLYERAMEAYFGSHPLSHRVLGTVESITNLSRDQMTEYFFHRYSADNTVVALAGRFDFSRMVDRLAEHCGAWPKTNPARDRSAPCYSPQEFTISSDSVHRHYLLMLCPAPALSDERRYAASILTQILGDSDGSRLHWALIDTGLAEEAQAQYDGRDGLGEFMIYASCSPANAQVVTDIIRREINALMDSLTEDDVRRVQRKIATGITLAGELPAGRMRRLGRVWAYLGEYRSLDEELARINAVTIRDLHALHERFPIRPLVTAHLSPASPAQP